MAVMGRRQRVRGIEVERESPEWLTRGHTVHARRTAGLLHPLLGRDGLGTVKQGADGSVSVVAVRARQETHRFRGKSTSKPFLMARW